jgi:sigma-E factor negative regulatory protein RseB
VSTRTEKSASGSAGDTTHIVYSDGVANVSVFIATATPEHAAGWALLGNANSYTTENGGYSVTAVGEVPGVTVQRIATSMQRR